MASRAMIFSSSQWCWSGRSPADLAEPRWFGHAAPGWSCHRPRCANCAGVCHCASCPYCAPWQRTARSRAGQSILLRACAQACQQTVWRKSLPSRRSRRCWLPSPVPAECVPPVGETVLLEMVLAGVQIWWPWLGPFLAAKAASLSLVYLGQPGYTTYSTFPAAQSFQGVIVASGVPSDVPVTP